MDRRESLKMVSGSEADQRFRALLAHGQTGNFQCDGVERMCRARHGAVHADKQKRGFLIVRNDAPRADGK